MISCVPLVYQTDGRSKDDMSRGLRVWQKISTVLILVAVQVIEPSMAMAQQAPQTPSPQAPHWHWPGHWHGPQLWWICPLMMIVFFVLFIAAMRYFRFDRGWGPMHRGHYGPSSTAIEVLDERFARGEIDEDEYKAKKAAILSA